MDWDRPKTREFLFFTGDLGILLAGFCWSVCGIMSGGGEGGGGGSGQGRAGQGRMRTR